MLNEIFFLLSILFIINNLYFIYDKPNLELRFDEKLNFNKLEIFYYLLTALFWVWILVGIFSSHYLFFYALVIISVLRFPIYHISKSLYKSYEWLIPYANIITLSLLLRMYFT